MRAQALQYLATATLALLCASSQAADDKKAVFAHYMVGVIHEDHVHQDVDDAVAMGLDGFALNIIDPSTQYTRDVFDNMFDYARDNHPDFKLFISMDLWSQNDTLNFDGFFVDFLGHEAYYKGPNGYPFVSTYGNGGFSKEKWQNWRNRWSDKIYFVPDFAGMIGEGNQTASWWHKWDGVIDGLFDWESAWPERGLSTTSSHAADDVQMASTASQNKTYMIGMSMLQYKNSYGANIYRAGEENLSWRIHNILNMTTTPQFAQLLTWNDGPESHYLGTIWPEMNNDTDPTRYATQAAAPHNAIQPVLASFIAAFKAGLGAGDMQPAQADKDKSFVGALWYKPVLARTACANEDSGELHDGKPDGYEVAADVAAWAVVAAADAADGHVVRGYSGGKKIGEVDLAPGFNFGNFTALQEGEQCMEVRDAKGELVAVARGGGQVSADCPDGIFNLNPQVVGLADDGLDKGGCVGGDGGDDASNNDDGDDDDSWGVKGVALDRVCLLSALAVSFLSVSGLVGL
ncbi:hypothetical protein SLS54_006987 [Diplodia seriata]